MCDIYIYVHVSIQLVIDRIRGSFFVLMMKQQKTSGRLTVTLRPVLVERHDVPIRFRQFQSTTSC